MLHSSTVFIPGLIVYIWKEVIVQVTESSVRPWVHEANHIDCLKGIIIFKEMTVITMKRRRDIRLVLAPWS